MDFYDFKNEGLDRSKSADFFQKLFFGSFASDRLDAFYRPADPDELKTLLAKIGELKDAPADKVRKELTAAGLYAMRLPKEFNGLRLGLFYASGVVSRMSEAGWTGEVLRLLRSMAFQHAVSFVGNEEQKSEFLPLTAKGEETLVLNDCVEATLVKDSFRINGTAAFAAPGLAPAYAAILARSTQGGGLCLFIADMRSPGVRVEPKNERTVFSFENVIIPGARLLGELGQGAEIADGAHDIERLLLCACSGPARRCLEAARLKCQARASEENASIEHETAAGRLSSMAAKLFALDAAAQWSSRHTEDRNDLRLEAAAAYAFHTAVEPDIIEESLRLLESDNASAASAALDSINRRAHTEAGKPPLRVLGEEAIRRHLSAAGTWIDPGKTRGEKARLTVGIVVFYLLWYPFAWLGWSWWPRFRQYGRLAKHLRFAEKTGRRAARAAFHGMLLYRRDFSARHAFHERLAEIAVWIYAMTASVAHAQMIRESASEGGRADDLADAFCREARRKIKFLFQDLWDNEDVLKRRIAREILQDRYKWLERG